MKYNFYNIKTWLKSWEFETKKWVIKWTNYAFSRYVSFLWHNWFYISRK